MHAVFASALRSIARFFILVPTGFFNHTFAQEQTPLTQKDVIQLLQLKPETSSSNV